MANLIQARRFANRTQISNDLLVSASMSYTGKDPAPQSHAEHLAALKKLNLFEDPEIEQVLGWLDKSDFCTPRHPHVRLGFNPYSLDPQNIGQRQVLTSSVMHAVTMRHLIPTLLASRGKSLRILDVGCGFGYSTLLYARLAELVRQSQGTLQVIGCDYHQEFVDKASSNLTKYPVNGVKFVKHDFIKGTDSELGCHTFDISTFGFELSLDAIQSRKSLFGEEALLVVPLSESKDRTSEQDYSVLRHKRSGKFEIETKIMRTAFSQRIKPMPNFN